MSRVSLLVLGALLAALAPARAEEELRWELETPWRYTLTVDSAPAAPPSGAPLLLSSRLLTAADLLEGRRLGAALEDVGDLVWHYALRLPPPGAGEEEAVEEQHRIGSREVAVRGRHQTKVRGRKARLQSALRLSSEGPPALAGTLQLERGFDLKLGRLESASFTLELRLAPDPQSAPIPHRWTGTITPAEPVDLSEAAFPARVQGAIDKATLWLRRELQTRLGGYKGKAPERFAVGRVALPTFALLRAGVAPAELEPAFEWLLRQPLEDTYSVSLLILALEARSVRREPLPPLPSSRSVARYQRGAVPPADLARIEQAARWLVGVHRAGWWSYFGGVGPDGKPLPLAHDGKLEAKSGDRSNSQFAILALHAALACGVDVPAEVFQAVLAELLGAQAADGPAAELVGSDHAEGAPLGVDPRDLPLDGTRVRGSCPLGPEELARGLARGWSYGMVTRATAGACYGSMSAAGVSSLAVAREALRRAARLEEAREREALLALRDGLLWLLAHFDVERHPGRGDGNYYYFLYSLEKALDLSGVERLGGHEWWREGAAALLTRQEADGSWAHGLEDTSFALLFLNRASLPSRLEVEAAGRVATGERDPSLWDRAVVDGVGAVRLRQVLRSLGQSGPAEAKDRLSLAERALAALPEEERPRLLPELCPLLSSPLKAVRRWARETSLALAGSDEPAPALRFAASYEALRLAGERGDPIGGLEPVRAALGQGEASSPLKQAALRTISRLAALEATPELLGLLGDRDLAVRTLAGQVLVALHGARLPWDPRGPASQRSAQQEAWRAWWGREGPGRLQADLARRAAAELSQPARAEAAAATLRGLGRTALRPLIDALRDDRARERAHQLLLELSGEKLPPTPAEWLEWWERSEAAAGR